MQVFSMPAEWRQGVSYVAIGTFDGVHLGHQELLRNLVEAAAADGVPAVVVTFDRHPLEVLRPELAPPALTHPAQKQSIFAGFGIDGLCCLPFTPDLARVPAERFVREYLVGGLGLKGVFIGYNFTFGHRGLGTPRLLEEMAGDYGYFVRVLPPFRVAGQVVSSTRIRRLIGEGRVAEAAALLGRPFQVRGRVIRGDGRGHEIGIPTANLNLAPRLALPARGVYAARVRGGDLSSPGVVNVGVRPTFVGEELRFEVHLLDFAGDLYDRTLEVDLIDRIRDERRFDGVEALTRQIRADISRAREILRE